MILFIDTSDYEQAQIALVGESVVWHKFDSRNLSEQLLPEIKKFCKKQKVKLSDLDNIAVVVGPGGFSRIRTAVSTANGLAYGLSIPVFGLEKKQAEDLSKIAKLKGQKMAVPVYDKEPNITLAKK